MKATVISTTDRQYLGMEFDVENLFPENITEATGGRFTFDRISLEADVLTLQNANYTALLKLTQP